MEVRVPIIFMRGCASKSACGQKRARARLRPSEREGNCASARCSEGETAYGVWGGMDSLIMIDGIFMSIFLWYGVFPSWSLDGRGLLRISAKEI